MRFGDWIKFLPHIDFGCFLVVCVNSLLAKLEALLPSFQGLVIFMKDLLTHIEFDQSLSKDSLVESSQVFLTLPRSTPIELLLESQVFFGCTSHFFLLVKVFIIIMS